jgi:glycosyltransferase involved in cell wall biosynthesis
MASYRTQTSLVCLPGGLVQTFSRLDLKGMKKVEVNVLVVCYNQEKYIGQAMESILMQRFKGDLNLIIADDASTDKTLEIIRSYEAKSPFSFIYLISETNLGIFHNYRRAYAACNGDYIAVMEGDDYWLEPDRIQKHVDFLEVHQDCVMSMNRLNNFYQEQNRFVAQKWPYKADYQYISARMLAMGNLLGNLSACVLRNSAVKKLKPEIFDINTADWMLGLALGEWGYIAKLKDLSSVYRISQSGLWSRKTKKQRLHDLNETVTRYDQFLEYRYSKEFSALRRILWLEQYAPAHFMKVFRRLYFPIIKRKLHQ